MSAAPSSGPGASAGAPPAALRAPEDHWDTAPVLYDLIDRAGRILLCNRTQAEALGYRPGELAGVPLETIYTRSSAERLREGFAEADGSCPISQQRLQMRRRDRSLIEVVANGDLILVAGAPALRLVKTRVDAAVERLEHLERENQLLRGFVDTARDACWCIEFAESVDLGAPDHEVVRQVFENECYWRLCNQAMARLYKLPEGLDFNQQNVRFVFPRNPENEAFVEQLIRTGFHVDGAPSYDQRYDGRWIHAENDVRAHIEGGRLLRIWGTVRNMSDQKRKEQELTARADAMLGVLSSAPDPILVVTGEGLLEAANPALQWRFGWELDDVLGRPLAGIVTGTAAVEQAIRTARPGAAGKPVALEMRCRDGRAVACEASVAAIAEEERGKRVVVTLRPAAAKIPGRRP